MDTNLAIHIYKLRYIHSQMHTYTINVCVCVIIIDDKNMYV